MTTIEGIEDAYTASDAIRASFSAAWRAARIARDDDAYIAARARAIRAGLVVKELTSLDRWGDRGWRWTEVWHWAAGNTQERVYRTNGDGEGCFFRNAGAYSQDRGTCQFRLPAQRGLTVARILRRTDIVNRL